MATRTYTFYFCLFYIAYIEANKHLTTEDVIKKISRDEQQASQLVQRAIITASRKKTRSRLLSHNRLLELLNENRFFVQNKRHSRSKAAVAALKHRIHRKVKIPNLSFTEPAENYREPRVGYHVFVSKNSNRANTKVAPTFHDIERDVNKMLESAKKLKNESAVLQENAQILENQASALQAENKIKPEAQKIEKGKKVKLDESKIKLPKQASVNLIANPVQKYPITNTNSVTAVITPDELFGIKPVQAVAPQHHRKLIKTDTTFVTTSDGTKVAFQDEPYDYIEPSEKVTASVSNYQSQPFSSLQSIETVPSFATNRHTSGESILDNINNIVLNHPVATEAPVVLQQPVREEPPVVVQTLQDQTINNQPVVASATDIIHHDTSGIVSTGHPDKLTAHVFSHPQRVGGCETHVSKDTGFPLVAASHHVDPDRLKSGCHGQGPERGGSASRPELPIGQIAQPPKITPGLPPIIPVETGYPVYHIPPSSEEPAIVDYIKPDPPLTGINPYEILTSSSLNCSAYKTHSCPPAIPVVHHEPKVIPVVQTFTGELKHMQMKRPADFIIGEKKSLLSRKKGKDLGQKSKVKKEKKNKGKKKLSKNFVLNEKQRAILKKWQSEKHKILKNNMSTKDIKKEIKKFLKRRSSLGKKSRQKK